MAESDDRKDPAESGEGPAEKPILPRWAAVLAVLIVFVALALVVNDVGRPPPAPESTEATKPAIGGPFTLVNQFGETVTDADFKGRYMLVYFGYTYCPDVCPTELTEIGNALDILGTAADKITPIFISVDPDRDKPEGLKEYLSYFHPGLVGLTGTPEQVAAAAKAYKVYFHKTEAESGDPDDYLVDHTAIVYLMGPDGKFLTHFSHNTTADAMAEKIRKYL